MRQATDVHSTQVLTLFGGGYVPEQRADQMLWNLAAPDDEVTSSPTALTFGEVMQSLRSALSLR